MSLRRKVEMVDSQSSGLSVLRQCVLLGLCRSSYYFKGKGESELNLKGMRLIDEQYLRTPFYGARQMARFLGRQGYDVGRKRVRRLMRKMGLQAIYQVPRTSIGNSAHRIYPYLLRDLAITKPNQVWATDITYIPMRCGFLYLVAIMDWHSRNVLAWRLSNSMDTSFCVEALQQALQTYGPPELFNTDQGSQFTSHDFTQPLKDAGVKISMDAKRTMDRQCFHRTTLAILKIRMHLPERL